MTCDIFLTWCDICVKPVFSLACPSARNSAARGWAASDECDKMAACFQRTLQTFKHCYVCVLCLALMHIYLNCNIDMPYSPRMVSFNNGWSWIPKHDRCFVLVTFHNIQR